MALDEQQVERALARTQQTRASARDWRPRCRPDVNTTLPGATPTSAATRPRAASTRARARAALGVDRRGIAERVERTDQRVARRRQQRRRGVPVEIGARTRHADPFPLGPARTLAALARNARIAKIACIRRRARVVEADGFSNASGRRSAELAGIARLSQFRIILTDYFDGSRRPSQGKRAFRGACRRPLDRRHATR